MDAELLEDMLKDFGEMVKKSPDAERTGVGFLWMRKGDKGIKAE